MFSTCGLCAAPFRSTSLKAPFGLFTSKRSSKAMLHPGCSGSFLSILTNNVKIFCSEWQRRTHMKMLCCHSHCCMYCKTTPERHVARWHQQIGVIILTKGVFLQVRAIPATLLQLACCSKATACTSQCYSVGSYTLLVMTSHILTTSCTWDFLSRPGTWRYLCLADTSQLSHLHDMPAHTMFLVGTK